MKNIRLLVQHSDAKQLWAVEVYEDETCQMHRIAHNQEQLARIMRDANILVNRLLGIPETDGT